MRKRRIGRLTTNLQIRYNRTPPVGPESGSKETLAFLAGTAALGSGILPDVVLLLQAGVVCDRL